MAKGTKFTNVSDLFIASDLSIKYNLAVVYSEEEDSYFAADNKEADIFEALLTVNKITFDRVVDALY